MTEAEQITRFKQITEHLLPERARERRWPLRLDHCFKRVCLDHAFQDVWYRHLKKPAERHISGTPLTRALHCAEALLHDDGTLLTARNRESLRWRGKLRDFPGER